MIAQKILRNRSLIRLIKKNKFLYETAQGVRALAACRSRKIYSITLYLTNRCNSRCNICHIWRKQPKKDLPVDLIVELTKAKCLSRTLVYVVAGGEPLLHPDIDGVLEALRGCKYRISTNGLLPEKLEEIVLRHGVKEVDLSLDGIGETYRAARGVDGYDKVIESIDRVRDKAVVKVNYTFSAYNRGRDFEEVKQLCEEKGVELAPNIYTTNEYCETFDAREPIPAFEWDSGSGVTNPFLLLYNAWHRGEVVLPCLSLRSKTNVYSNGDVSLCQVKLNIIGSLKEQTMDAIWNSPETIRLQNKFARCNDCWVSCNRENDVHLMRFLSHFTSKKRLAEKFGVRGLELLKQNGQRP